MDQDPTTQHLEKQMARAIQARHYSSLVALLVLLLFHVFNLRTERDYIFRRPINLVKVIYVSARYLALATLIINYALIHKYLIPRRTSGVVCQLWFSFLFTMTMSIGALLSLVLFLRVYALYRKSTWLLVFLIPIAAQVVIPCILDLTLFRHGADQDFSSHCNKIGAESNEAIVVGALSVSTHTLLFIAAIIRRNASQQHVAKMVHRDSILVYVFFCSVTAGFVLYTRAVALEANPFVIFTWSTVIYSVVACKLILDIRRMPVQERREPLDDVSIFLYELSEPTARVPTTYAEPINNHP